MHEYFFLILTTVLVNNVVLIKFLGLCPIMGVSKQVSSSVGMGLATCFVLTLAAGADPDPWDMVGAEIVYTEGLEGAQFVIRNPNATTTCGCGSSFSP